MKSLLVSFLLIICFAAAAQTNDRRGYNFGIRLGGANCNVSGARVKSEAKGGLTAGFWLQLKMSKLWTIQGDLFLVQKGSGGWSADKPVTPGEYLLNLSYLELPVLFQYHPGKLSFEFGPGIGILLSQHENLVGDAYPDLTDQYPFTRKEFSFNIGTGYSFNVRWYLGFRFTHSLQPVRTQIPAISQQAYNRAFTIFVARSLTARKKKSRTEDNQFN